MSNDSDNGKIPATIKAVTDLANVVPIYQDALQPAMQETGKALAVVGRAVNVAIAPVRGLVWGAEKVEEWLVTKVTQKLAKTPEAEIVTPDLSVAGPLFDALKYNGHKPELSEMYASLLAAAMQDSTQILAHPTFVDKIRSMTPLDARIFAIVADLGVVPTINVSKEIEGIEGAVLVAGFISPRFHELGLLLGLNVLDIYAILQGAIENLEGLGLIDAVSDGYLTAAEQQKAYDDIEASDLCQGFRNLNQPGNHTFSFQRTYVRVTQIGKNFQQVTAI